MDGWLVTIAQLPTEDPAARMRVLRTLESLGAAVMREGAYLLPDTATTRQALEALAEYIVKSAGTAQVLQVNATNPGQRETLQRLFDRSARYDALIKTVESLLDFFPTEARSRAEHALAEVDAAVKKLLFTSSQTRLDAGERLLRRAWVTRKPPWADRLACAWLIRRFVDPEATLTWLEKTEELPAGALGFAFDGAHFAASGARVAYEEMLAQLQLAKNPALGKIGSIVHFLEMGGTAVPEAAGVQTLLQGAVRRSENVNELLAEVEKTFDLLYEAYYEPAKR